MPGIAAISGSTKEKNGKRIVFTHRAGDKPGEGRMYIRPADCYRRTTPMSEKEIEAKVRFQRVSWQLNHLGEETKVKFAREWEKDGYKFNGKKYATLRGYIFARLHADI